MKKLVALGVLGALGFALASRRRLPLERLDVYREDGTLETFESGSATADRALPVAREIFTIAG